jgi:hypothetical protein
MATGLGSIDALMLVTNWLGVPMAPSYTITASPSNLTAAANQSATSTINISSTTGFTGVIALSCASVPVNAQVSCAIAPSTVTLNSGTITASATVTAHAPADSTILVKGTSNSKVQFARVTLSIQ